MSLGSGASNLRKVLEDPNGFVCAPGVYDGLSARMALGAGFDALYMVSRACTVRSAANTKYSNLVSFSLFS